MPILPHLCYFHHHNHLHLHLLHFLLVLILHCLLLCFVRLALKVNLFFCFLLLFKSYLYSFAHCIWNFLHYHLESYLLSFRYYLLLNFLIFYFLNHFFFFFPYLISFIQYLDYFHIRKKIVLFLRFLWFALWIALYLQHQCFNSSWYLFTFIKYFLAFLQSVSLHLLKITLFVSESLFNHSIEIIVIHSLQLIVANIFSNSYSALLNFLIIQLLLLI